MTGQTLEGRTIAADELEARWSYSEIASTRFAQRYHPHVPAALRKLAHRRVDFDRLPRPAWHVLGSALHSVRPSNFIGMLRDEAQSNYACVHWGVQHLLNCLTIPEFGAVPFYRFLAMPAGQLADGGLRTDDPRVHAHAIPNDPGFRVDEPVIAVRHGDRHMLVDGYLRSILWLRNMAEPLPVWIPKG